jgi:hypothetical protein
MMEGRSTDVTPIPKITQPWLVPFAKWRSQNAYVIDCVASNLRTVLSSTGSTALVAFDWNGMREDLARYLYSTGHSRFRSFRHHCGQREVGGPSDA